jgi:hypothetical protein
MSDTSNCTIDTVKTFISNATTAELTELKTAIETKLNDATAPAASAHSVTDDVNKGPGGSYGGRRRARRSRKAGRKSRRGSRRR